MKYLYFLLILFMSCSIKKQSFIGEYTLHCVDFDSYSLNVYRNNNFRYNYTGHLMHSTKNGNWKINGDTLTLFADNEIFKRFRFKNALLCEILTINDDTIFCKHCYKNDK